MSSSTDNNLPVGVVILIRHGDRMGFYQDPGTYTATETEITPLGNQQEFQLGTYLRSLYINESSPLYIQGLSTALFDQSQILVQADLGGEGGVIYDSCVSLTQGLWPATTNNNITLANGTTITAPLDGYQYVPIEGVDPDDDMSLEGFQNCSTFNAHTTAFYNSSQFQEMKSQSAAFLNLLPPYLGGRPTSLTNMWNIFDYMNVNYIHNATFAAALPPTFLAQARGLANWHEYNVFSDASLSGIGNIAGRAIIPTIFDAFETILDTKNPTKLFVTAISYKPFLSLFNMTGVAAANPQLAGIVDYASVVALELRQPNGDPAEATVRFNFKNGSDPQFTTYNWMGTTGDVKVTSLYDALWGSVVNGTADWCSVCQNTQVSSCAALNLAAQQARAAALSPIGPVGAGFLGAGMTIILFGVALGSLLFFGLLKFKRPLFGRRKNRGDDQVELSKAHGYDDSVNAPSSASRGH
ncbi:histidine phosphatase superfamily [Pisolithus marmoratus]|nr:histidine phosphatase superfamily [Pisolithus marmoratus]